jgi:hypothetical protein
MVEVGRCISLWNGCNPARQLAISGLGVDLLFDGTVETFSFDPLTSAAGTVTVKDGVSWLMLPAAIRLF